MFSRCSRISRFRGRSMFYLYSTKLIPQEKKEVDKFCRFEFIQGSLSSKMGQITMFIVGTIKMC